MATQSENFMLAMDEERVNFEVNDAVALYDKTKDGRYFWRAFLLLHKAGRPVPKNFLDKLASIGESLLSADSVSKVAAALEFSGGKKRYVGCKTSMAFERRWRVAGEVQQMKDLYNLSLEKVFSLVARRRMMTVGMVKADYHKVAKAAVKPTRKTGAAPILDQAMRRWLEKL